MIDKQAYTVAQYLEDITRRREDMSSFFRVVKTIFYERTLREWVKILFLPRENKIYIFKPPCNFFLLCRHECFTRKCTNNCAKAGNDANDILTSVIRKIRHSGPGCSFVWILRTVYFPVKHSCLYNKMISRERISAAASGQVCYVAERWMKRGVDYEILMTFLPC